MTRERILPSIPMTNLEMQYGYKESQTPTKCTAFEALTAQGHINVHSYHNSGILGYFGYFESSVIISKPACYMHRETFNIVVTTDLPWI